MVDQLKAVAGAAHRKTQAELYLQLILNKLRPKAVIKADPKQVTDLMWT